MDTLLQNLRYGLRGLWKDRAFTFVAVLTLALGIGANASIYSFLDALVLNPYDFPEMDRLVFLTERAPEYERMALSPANFLDARERLPQVEHLSAYDSRSANLTGGGGEPEQLLGYAVSPSLFAALGVPAQVGRTLQAGEDTPGQEHVVVLGHGLWQRRFGADPSVVGHTVTLDGQPHTVVGVMPRDFFFPRGAQFFTPLVFSAEEKVKRRAHYLEAVGRLRADTSLAQASAAAQPVLDGAHPEDPKHRLGLAPLREVGDLPTRRLMWVLMAAVVLVLLAACANVASMLLARAARRERELAIRSALGASRGRLVGQLLTESLLLALLGGGFGLLLALWGVDLMHAAMPADTARWIAGWERAGLNGRMLGFTLGTAALTTVAVGLVPALRASRTDPSATLRMEGRGMAGSVERHRMRQVLVGVQMAFALVLTVGACLNVRSFSAMMGENPGFEREGLLSFRVIADEATFPRTEDITGFHQAVVERLRHLPGASDAAAVNNLPLGFNGATTALYIEGQPPPPPGQEPQAQRQVVTPEYFRTMRIPLREGEGFTGRERGDGPKVVLISASLARRAFGNQSPIGHRIALAGRPEALEWRTVVGVVGDVQQRPPLDPYNGKDAIYLPLTQKPERGMTFTVRTAGEPLALAQAARREVAAVHADVPVTDVKTMQRVIHEAYTAPRYAVALMLVFAAIALVLSAVGLYGVMAYGVSQRAREIGIRMALGARAGDVARLVVGQALWPALAGMGFGLVGAFALARGMGSLLYGVSPVDPLSFGAMPLVLGGVAALAALRPVRTAVRVDPAVAFRSE